MTDLLPFIVAFSTWMSASPQHAEGLLVYYGSQQLIEANAAYRGYSLAPYKGRCGVSAISPADLGKIVWLRVEGREWYGPCLFIDVGAKHDFYNLVYIKREVAEVGPAIRNYFNFKWGSSAWGEIYIGLCPPLDNTSRRPYQPPLAFNSTDYRLPYTQWPEQQLPVDCTKNKE